MLFAYSESSILLFAKMTAPTMAASNKNEAISNGSKKSVKSIFPTAFVVPNG